MYFPEITNQGGTYVQGFVRSELPKEDSNSRRVLTTWAKVFKSSASLWRQLQPLSAALRIERYPGLPTTIVHSFVVDRAELERLKMVLAALLRTDSIGTALTEAPYSDKDLDGRFLHSGEHRVVIDREPLTTSEGTGIYYNEILGNHFATASEQLLGIGIPVAYECQFAEWAIPSDVLKDILYDVSRLSDSTAAPDDLIADQQEIVTRLKKATFHFEECISTNSAEAMDSVVQVLSRLLDGSVYARLGAAPELKIIDNEETQSFSNHVHSHLVYGIPQSTTPAYASSATTSEFTSAFLEGSILGIDELASENVPLVFTEPLASRLKNSNNEAKSESGSNGQPFYFVSYARDDQNEVYGAIDQFKIEGISYWIDRNIIGGDDWVEELEEKIIASSGILAFISSRFVDSKYCRRELKFADALGKMIIPVLLEETSLGKGLNFLLQGRQFIPYFELNCLQLVTDAIERHNQK